VTRLSGAVAVALTLACQIQTVPAARVKGVVVTHDGAPIEGAFVDLYLSVPVGVEGSPLEPLGTARSMGDGTYEVAYPEQRLWVNAGEKVRYGMHVLHPDWQAVGHVFYEIDGVPFRSPLAPLAPGRNHVADDCQALCTSRDPDQCREISLEYFGAEDVCAFRY
jgi:hypothetical protein